MTEEKKKVAEVSKKEEKLEAREAIKDAEVKQQKETVYATLSKIDVKPYIKKKMGLDYLSWATAWGLVKAHYPDAKKEFTEYPEFIPTKGGWTPTGRDVPYRLTPFGCEVEATVTINGEKTSQNLYVMNNKGEAVKANGLDMKLINKAQQRCLVKALATAGLGLDIYAGEDLPEEPAKKTPQRTSSAPSRQYRQPRKLSKTQLENYIVEFSDSNKHTLKEIFKRAKTSEIVKDWIKSGKYDVTTGTYIKQLGAIYKAEQKIKNESQNSHEAPDQFEDIIAK